jgi:hypothetical protein
VPRDRDASFDPVIVRKRQRRLDGIDEIVLSLTARGLTPARWPRTSPRSTARRSPGTPSRESSTRSLRRWPRGRTRPLDAIYPVIVVDAIHVKVRDGQVTNRPSMLSSSGWAALDNVIDHLRPGAPVAAVGGKWPGRWMWPLRAWIAKLHAPFIADFTGFDKPWRLVAESAPDLRVRELAFGAGYLALGHARRR